MKPFIVEVRPSEVGPPDYLAVEIANLESWLENQLALAIKPVIVAKVNPVVGVEGSVYRLEVKWRHRKLVLTVVATVELKSDQTLSDFLETCREALEEELRPVLK